MVYVTHALERTSPKGKGIPFVGRCIRCGMTNLLSSAALEPCENHKEMSDDDVLLAVIRHS